MIGHGDPHVISSFEHWASVAIVVSRQRQCWRAMDEWSTYLFCTRMVMALNGTWVMFGAGDSGELQEQQ